MGHPTTLYRQYRSITPCSWGPAWASRRSHSAGRSPRQSLPPPRAPPPASLPAGHRRPAQRGARAQALHRPGRPAGQHRRRRAALPGWVVGGLPIPLGARARRRHALRARASPRAARTPRGASSRQHRSFRNAQAGRRRAAPTLQSKGPVTTPAAPHIHPLPSSPHHTPASTQPPTQTTRQFALAPAALPRVTAAAWRRTTAAATRCSRRAGAQSVSGQGGKGGARVVGPG